MGQKRKEHVYTSNISRGPDVGGRSPHFDGRGRAIGTAYSPSVDEQLSPKKDVQTIVTLGESGILWILDSSGAEMARGS